MRSYRVRLGLVAAELNSLIADSRIYSFSDRTAKDLSEQLRVALAKVEEASETAADLSAFAGLGLFPGDE